MGERDPERVIRGEVIVDAPVDQVWEAWTSADGITSFFAPACNIDMRVDGLYEILFDPDAVPGERGAEGVRILALDPGRMLSFTWNAPPSMPNVRKQWTHVTIRFDKVGPRKTRVILAHDGWGEGPEWDQAYAYFVRAWNDVVLKRLVHRFSIGRVDWAKPPHVA